MFILSLPMNRRRTSLRAIAWLATVFSFSLMLVACYRLPVPIATTVNPETFPQIIPEEISRLPENPPPPVTANQTFIMIDGIPMYRIGPGDVLDIFITRGATQDRIQAVVRANGRISVLQGEANVDGLTTDQAGSEVARELSRFYRQPSVDVTVKEYNSKKLSILGVVGQTTRGAVLPLTGRTTLVEAVARVGGFGPTARTEEIRITRGSKTYTVNMFQYIQEGERAQDVILDAGDVILIPERARDEEQRVFVLGEVKTPGPVPFRPRMTLAQLVGQVGGWTDGARIQEARIIRGDPKNPEVIGIDLNRLILDGDRRIDQYLQPNDVVLIPRTTIADWNAYLAQLRPTLEFIVLSAQPYIIYRTIK
jgi:polysaccharide export outer membrane protein